MTAKLRLIVMGVSGCGKSSLGTALAAHLGIGFRDGDDLHPPANLAKMRAGEPLNDADRWPWLDLVAQELAGSAPLVIACSALRRAYRARIAEGAGGPLRFVHLTATREVLAPRLAARRGHFMPPALLDSQLAALEPPGPHEALTLDAGQSLKSLIALVRADLDQWGN